MARASRIRRKDLKQPDEFITLTTRAVLWLQAHRQIVTWSGAGVLIALAAGGIFLSFQATQLRDANAELGQGMAALRGGDVATAAPLLASAAQRWSATSPGRVAGLLAAGAELQRDSYDSAIVQSEQVWARRHELPSHLQQELLFVWAAALEGKGDLAAAAEKYAAAASGDGAYTALAMLGEARARTGAGEKERAAELYRAYLERFPDARDREIVEATLGS